LRGGPAREHGMKCPYCDADMTAGDIEVRSNWVSFFFWGLQFQNLVFDSGGKSRVVLEPREKRPALRCQSCKATVIAGPASKRDVTIDPDTGEVAESWKDKDPWGADAGR